MNQPIGTIITDCTDNNARARQELRFQTLFGVTPTFLGVQSYTTIEAAGNLIDQLDVLTNFPNTNTDTPIIILVNVAPRGEDIKEKWANGTPFCYFRLNNVLIVSTIDGQCLALARDLGIVDQVEVFDIPTVTAAAVQQGDLTAAEAEKINQTQFRSLEFMPLVAAWLLQGKTPPSKPWSLSELPSSRGQAWFIDNFDNVKTTLLPADVDFADGKKVTLANGAIATCYTHLADVPKDTVALTIGSSGYGPHRFLEVVIGHRGRAASLHGFKVGSPILATTA